MRTSIGCRIASAALALVVVSCQPESVSEPTTTHEGAAHEGAAGDSAVGVAKAGLVLGSYTYTPSADTVLRSAIPYGNDGTGVDLGVTSLAAAEVERSIVRFSQTQIRTAFPGSNVLQSARLDIFVNGISAGWFGGAVDLHAMNREWTEGTGLAGNGASWVCANDTNTTWFGLWTNNCSAANNWSMTTPAAYPRPFNPIATDRVPVFTGGLTRISFDVTADVRAVRAGATHYGWMLAGAPNLAGGEWFTFSSREASASLRPQLVISYGSDDCPTDPNKGLPGACGCGKPDLDTNLDNVADCFEAAVPATGDTAIRLAIPFGNDGTGLFLPTTAASIVDIERSLIKVDNAAINAARHGAPINKAYLEFTVAGIAVGWAGGQLALQRMNATPSWVEGTGTLGHGASWTCADDFNTTVPGNFFDDCVPTDSWYMSPFQWTIFPKPYIDPPTGIVGVTWPGMNSVRFDVTADVQAFISNPASNNGWILQGHASNFASGNWINFSSRESAAPPRLLLDISDSCPTTGKASPGACGCSIPETDTDGDGTPDCVDECPNNNPRIVKGACGCGDVVDTDTDGLPNCIDPCPNDADRTLGGTCGCPSDPAPPGTLCEGPCGGSGDPSGMDECDGAGHCGGTPGTASCPSPDPTCPGCRAFVVKGLSSTTPFSVYWHCPCTRGGTVAEGACDDVPGHHLAQVSSAEQNAFIRSLIDSDTWIGANDRSMEGDWRWEWSEGPDGARFWSGGSSGTASGYENWQTGEPGGGGTEDCGAMRFTGTAGDWQDRSCGLALDFVCERAIESTDDDGNITETVRTCTYLGNRCPPFDTACVDESTLPGINNPEQLKEDLQACQECTEDCNGSDPPTPEQQDECRDTCTDEPGAPCNGNAAPPNPLTAVPCDDLDDYELELTTLTDPEPEKHCPIKVPLPPAMFGGLTACENHQKCIDENVSGALHCGEVFHCRDCDPTVENCPQCAGGTVLPPGVSPCPSRMVGGREQNVCVAQKYCGEEIDECFLDDDNSVLCTQYNFCADPGSSHALPGPPDAAGLEEPTIFDPEAPGAFDVPPIAPPDPYFPEDKACPTEDCVAPNNPLHPWCHYDVTEGLEPQEPDSLQKPVATGDDNILTFNVEPGVDLIYETELGPLGMPMPLLAAEASFIAKAEINLFGLTAPLDLIDLAAGARGGIHNDADVDRRVCGFKAYARAVLLGVDVLPEDVNFAMPGMNGDQDVQEQCLEAVDEFRVVVDSARKAFADARELVRQYKKLKEDSLYFPDGSDEDFPSLCEQIAKSPPRGFPVWGDCETEKPVDTINRFIAFYNHVVIQNVRIAAGQLGAEVDALIAAQSGIDNTYEILTPVHADEQVTLFNTTFMVGPVPCNLEVLLTMQYGIGADLLAEFRIGQLINDIVAYDADLAKTPVIKAGLVGGPSAGMGVSLFAGVGFDIGFAAAKIGIDGAIDLGHASVPVTAWAGIGVTTKSDDREPPLSWADDVDADSGHLIPTKRLAFDLLYGYRADLVLNHVLSGSLGVRLKLKFFFFSVNYRKAIISFDGLCPPEDPGRDPWCDIPLFRAGGRGDLEWGEIELPMPFFPLKPLDTWEIDPPGTEEFDTSKVGEVFYDSQCQCVPMWSDFDPPKQDCYRPEDCCSQESYPGVLICYTNPEPVNGEIRSQCTTCRAPGANCTKDSECCNAETHSCYKEGGPDAPAGICRPKGNTCYDCTRDEDCSDATIERECGPRNFCITGPDSCTVE